MIEIYISIKLVTIKVNKNTFMSSRNIYYAPPCQNLSHFMCSMRWHFDHKFCKKACHSNILPPIKKEYQIIYLVQLNTKLY
jgi:hypothetical protein